MGCASKRLGPLGLLGAVWGPCGPWLLEMVMHEIKMEGDDVRDRSLREDLHEEREG